MGSDLTNGAITLAAVIVGAGSTAGVQWFTERRRERRLLRLAARRLMDELVWVRAIVADGRSPDTRRSVTTWEEVHEHFGLIGDDTIYWDVRAGIRAAAAAEENEVFDSDRDSLLELIDRALAALMVMRLRYGKSFWWLRRVVLRSPGARDPSDRRD